MSGTSAHFRSGLVAGDADAYAAVLLYYRQSYDVMLDGWSVDWLWPLCLLYDFYFSMHMSRTEIEYIYIYNNMSTNISSEETSSGIK